MSLVAAVDPGITPNANFPFLESLKQIGGGILVGAFIVIAIVAIIGAAMLLAGKLSQSSRLTSGGGVIRLWIGPVGHPRRDQRLHPLVTDGVPTQVLRRHACRM